MCKYCEIDKNINKHGICNPILNLDIYAYKYGEFRNQCSVPLYSFIICVAEDMLRLIHKHKDGHYKLYDSIKINYCPMCGKKLNNNYLDGFRKEYIKICNDCGDKYTTHRSNDNICPKCLKSNSTICGMACNYCIENQYEKLINNKYYNCTYVDIKYSGILNLNDAWNEGQILTFHINKKDKTLDWYYYDVVSIDKFPELLGSDSGDIEINYCPFCGEVL